MTNYRVLYYLLDPFVGSRVAIGSLTFIDGVAEFVRCALPDGVQLVGASATMVERACERLAKRASENDVDNLGPCFALGPALYTPRVDDPRAWLSLLGTSNTEYAR